MREVAELGEAESDRTELEILRVREEEEFLEFVEIIKRIRCDVD